MGRCRSCKNHTPTPSPFTGLTCRTETCKTFPGFRIVGRVRTMFSLYYNSFGKHTADAFWQKVLRGAKTENRISQGTEDKNIPSPPPSPNPSNNRKSRTTKLSRKSPKCWFNFFFSYWHTRYTTFQNLLVYSQDNLKNLTCWGSWLCYWVTNASVNCSCLIRLNLQNIQNRVKSRSRHSAPLPPPARRPTWSSSNHISRAPPLCLPFPTSKPRFVRTKCNLPCPYQKKATTLTIGRP